MSNYIELQNIFKAFAYEQRSKGNNNIKIYMPGRERDDDRYRYYPLSLWDSYHRVRAWGLIFYRNKIEAFVNKDITNDEAGLSNVNIDEFLRSEYVPDIIKKKIIFNIELFS